MQKNKNNTLNRIFSKEGIQGLNQDLVYASMAFSNDRVMLLNLLIKFALVDYIQAFLNSRFPNKVLY